MQGIDIFQFNQVKMPQASYSSIMFNIKVVCENASAKM